MSNILQFSLGLTAGNFLSGVRGAGGAVTAFTAAANALNVPLRGVLGQIERGGHLFDLSRRIDVGVGSLYSFQRGLQEVGVDTGNATQLIQQMNKALGGVNDAGEPTKDVFASIGLSIEGLKRQDPVKAFQQITAVLGKLGASDATFAASKIFGRGGAGDALQIARSGREFSDAIERAGRGAAVFGANARAFDAIGDAFEQMKENIRIIYAELAGKIVPVVQGLAGAFQGGKMAEVLSLATGAIGEGLENSILLLADPGLWSGVVSVAIGAFGALGTFLIKMLGTVGAAFVAGIKTALANGFGGPAGKGLAKLLGFKGNFAENFKEGKAGFGTAFEGVLGNNFQIAAGLTADGLKAIFDAIKDHPILGPKAKQLSDLLAGFVDADAAGNRGQDAAKKVLGGLTGKTDRGQGNALERIGFNFGGGVDHARETARNTGQIVTQLGLLTSITKNNKPQTFANK